MQNARSCIKRNSTCFAFVVASCTCLILPLGIGSAAELSHAIAEYEYGHYKQSRALFDDIVAAEHGRLILSEAHLYLGMINLIEGDEVNAGAQIRLALCYNPDLELDPARFSPGKIAFFGNTKMSFPVLSTIKITEGSFYPLEMGACLVTATWENLPTSAHHTNSLRLFAREIGSPFSKKISLLGVSSGSSFSWNGRSANNVLLRSGDYAFTLVAGYPNMSCFTQVSAECRVILEAPYGTEVRPEPPAPALLRVYRYTKQRGKWAALGAVAGVVLGYLNAQASRDEPEFEEGASYALCISLGAGIGAAVAKTGRVKDSSAFRENRRRLDEWARGCRAVEERNAQVRATVRISVAKIGF
ncbi:MAG: hypothetical protein IH621_01650 [Krumholzibacteria bacterium]|nr:hypothetical protein [Candidatus Krumholzibacteria bacterium]